MVQNAIDFSSEHVLLANASHMALGVGLAVVLQRHRRGTPFVPVWVGGTLLAFALGTHACPLASGSRALRPVGPADPFPGGSRRPARSPPKVLTRAKARSRRVFVVNEPEAPLMGIFGAVAQAMNVSAPLVLIRHRTGDANVPAIRRFSRDDAIGNALAVLAKRLVAWTATPWPDLVVAALIAGLFLHASSMVRDARNDRRDASLRRPAQEPVAKARPSQRR